MSDAEMDQQSRHKIDIEISKLLADTACLNKHTHWYTFFVFGTTGIGFIALLTLIAKVTGLM